MVWDTQLGGLAGRHARHRVAPAAAPRHRAGRRARRSGPRARCSRSSSKKVARAINAASGRRPLVVLANLAGFDGSPESMRRLQLEYGAEIGRAVVNFDGPIVFCVVSRFHGGAFVVFSRALNDELETIALEGAHASVIGGAPAAAVVFARDVDERTREDARIAALDERDRRRRAARSASACAPSATRCGRRCARRSSASSRRSSTPSTASSAPSQVGSVDRIVPPPRCGRPGRRGRARHAATLDQAGGGRAGRAAQ